MATQEQRRSETRAALLDAGATLFAERGIAGASVDAIAAAAGRTSGALYDHFGSKDGLLFALLEAWVSDATLAITAEQATAETLDEWLAAMWHAVVDPPGGDRRWIALEHELWAHAAKDDATRTYLERRYRAAWDAIDTHARQVLGSESSGADGPAGDVRIGPAVIALLLGLEMMHRIDPDAVTDATAVAALRGVVTAPTPTPAEL